MARAPLKGRQPSVMSAQSFRLSPLDSVAPVRLHRVEVAITIVSSYMYFYILLLYIYIFRCVMCIYSLPQTKDMHPFFSSIQLAILSPAV